MAKAGKKHDPYLVHLWHELTQSKFLKLEGVAGWAEAPANIQGKFAAAARRAMQAALGVPAKRPKAKAAAKKSAAKAKSKSKAKPKRAAKAARGKH